MAYLGNEKGEFKTFQGSANVSMAAKDAGTVGGSGATCPHNILGYGGDAKTTLVKIFAKVLILFVKKM